MSNAPKGAPLVLALTASDVMRISGFGARYPLIRCQYAAFTTNTPPSVLPLTSGAYIISA
jgi:hypothetical protein